MSAPSRELLIVAPERWDEACFSVPAVRALAGAGLGIGLLCQPNQKAFWTTVPSLTVHTPETFTEEWQVALIWEPGDLVKVVRKAGIHKRLGPAVGKLTKQLSETLKDQPHVTEHRVQFYLKAVAEMGIPTAKPEFFHPVQLAVSQRENSVLLVPDSDFGSSHEWSLQRWQQVADELIGSHAVTIGQIEGGRNLGRELARHVSNQTTSSAVNLHEPEMDMIASHGMVVAADGSLPHIASHLGATCITLFGPNDARWKRPLGKRHHVVRRHVECAPCFTFRCPLDERCQEELEVSSVLKALRALGATAA